MSMVACIIHSHSPRIGSSVRTATKSPWMAEWAASHHCHGRVASLPGHFSTAIRSFCSPTSARKCAITKMTSSSKPLEGRMAVWLSCGCNPVSDSVLTGRPGRFCNRDEILGFVARIACDWRWFCGVTGFVGSISRILCASESSTCLGLSSFGVFSLLRPGVPFFIGPVLMRVGGRSHAAAPC